ncbi:MAG: hypothetical protein H7839_20015 [Magnetococcus sp. YQC-5]
MSRHVHGRLATEERKPSQTEPELALWIAVMHQAVRDAKSLLRMVGRDPLLWSNSKFRSEVRHLTEYFRTQSMEVGGFGFICDLVGLDPKQAVQQIEDKYLRHLVPGNKRSTRMADRQAA